MDKRQILVVGNGMVGQRFVDRFVALDAHATCDITVIGEETRPAYDRVALTSWFNGKTEADLRLVDDALLTGDRVDYRFGRLVAEIDTVSQKVALDDGSMLGYDELVIATGSAPFVPPIPGNDLAGCFVYRTIDDLEQIKAWATAAGRSTGLVIGGGLLGLEAANALRSLGLDVHVVEMAPYPMPQQLGEGGGRMLGRWVDSLGVQLHCGVAPGQFVADGSGSVAGLQMSDGTAYSTDIVVFSAGVRPRDEVARRSGIDVGERGGIVVDDTLQTSARHVWAIGEVALHRGRVYGLVAPGYEMAAALAERLADDGGAPDYRGSDMSTKLKLLGVDVASFGQSNATGDDVDEIVYNDPVNRIFRRLALDAASGALLGGAFVGDTSGYELLTAITLGLATQPDDLPAYVLPASVRPPDQGDLPDGALLCSCNAVSVGTIRGAVDGGCHTLGDVKSATCAGTSCGGCVPAVTALIRTQLGRLGLEVSNALCEHFDQSRRELYDLVRFHRYTSWAEVLTSHGRGHGCEICRPTVASILASLGNGHVLGGDQAAVQDTNDHHLANMQRNGTYSVVPRVPGGEITPDQLIALGTIAKDFDLYTKITGRPAHRPARRPAAGPPRDLASCHRRRDGVGSGVRQVVADGQVVRRLDLVPLRRAGLGGDGDPPGGALPRPAVATQDQDGRVGMHPRMCRGPEQGRRCDRHRERLEPVRRRQRWPEPAPCRPPRRRSERRAS